MGETTAVNCFTAMLFDPVTVWRYEGTRVRYTKSGSKSAKPMVDAEAGREMVTQEANLPDTYGTTERLAALMMTRSQRRT